MSTINLGEQVVDVFNGWPGTVDYIWPNFEAVDMEHKAEWLIHQTRRLTTQDHLDPWLRLDGDRYVALRWVVPVSEWDSLGEAPS